MEKKISVEEIKQPASLLPVQNEEKKGTTLPTPTPAPFTFESLALKEPLLRGIYGYGITKASEIQELILPTLLSGVSTILRCHSGSGKTLALAIALLQRINTGLDKIQGILLTPTRELAISLERVFTELGQFLHARVISCVGGVAMKETIQKLQQNPHIVIIQPGLQGE